MQDLNPLTMMADAGPVVLFVMFVLLALSVVSWSIIFLKYRFMRRLVRESTEFVDYFWKSRDLAEVFARSKQFYHSPLARVFRVGYVELKKVAQSMGSPAAGSDNAMVAAGNFVGMSNVKRSLDRAINTETSRMTQLVPFLATTGSSAPFIGLFGTVWGIMNSFHEIGLRGSANLAVVAPGISEALVATAAGLAAAIPAVIAFNYFMQKIRTIETEMVNFSSDFLNIVERDILISRK